MNSDVLTELLKLLPAVKPHPTRKADKAAAITQQLSGGGLRAAWKLLDETQQLAVAEALHGTGTFNAVSFGAKYGKLPEGFASRLSRTSSPLRLFLYPPSRYSYEATVLPVELAAGLRRFVAAPPELKIDGVAEAPATFRQPRRGYVPRGEQRPVDEVALTRRDTARAATAEVLALLRLVDQGQVAVSSKTRRPSAVSVRRIAALLDGGDFFDPTEQKERSWHQVPGPIRSFAWPMLLQASNLVELRGSRLALTKPGHAALRAPPATTLKRLWERWQRTTIFDEFSRIDDIKGQTRGRGKQAMTAPANRRRVVAKALRECPTGAWILFDEFSRFMLASSLRFEVTRDPWRLYLVDTEYGSLGYDGSHNWGIIQDRYMLCLLFEYAATLGIVDLAFSHPREARIDFTQLWGADELSYLSRYDGLRYFRINPLGEFCLGLADDYAAPTPESHASLRLFADLRLQHLGEPLTAAEELLLATYANREDDHTWRLDRTKMLLAVETGHDADELREFLRAHDDQDLPETVEGLLRRTARDARALKRQGTAIVFECATADLALRLVEDRSVGRLCQLAGDRRLVVPAKSEAAFRKAVLATGHGLAG